MSKEKFEYVARPDVADVFVDHIEQIGFDGRTMRIEFAVTRFDDPKPPAPMTGKRYTAARLVLSAQAAEQLHEKLNGLAQAFQQLAAQAKSKQ